MKDRPSCLLPKLVVNEDAANQVVNLQLIFEDQEDADSALTYSIENVSNATLFDSYSINPTDQLVLDFACRSKWFGSNYGEGDRHRGSIC